MNLTATGGSGIHGVGFGGRPQGPPSPPNMDATAGLLGMSSDELQQAQRSGTTLTELASQKGVSKDDLVASITKDLQANKPEGAAELDATQLTQMATNIADGVRPQGGPGGHGGHHHHGGQAGGDRAAQNLSALASALGTDTDTLLSKLQSGGDLTDWLSSLRSPTGYGSDATGAVAGGLQVDTQA
jgi:hypothetical protein